ncbi:hypothetical protein CB0940_07936 [Cercospora beticola]|uniref:Uncharacterized protein n=1 Tax=Cercospora beticola TaxID=122368 RepID=A0A2G5HAX4_CERBT|nr:hypothetical protein CB0940_07936 [Cercospora beticola]PIA89433.1 hypothetical protein CB0940_07936 [Cercospora beticola]WPB03906.1 hypothetical protein RHO25_008550 [Cercospora beticola]CAK1357311.1 unnamed protein product [Cercospora beticola]
MSRQKHAKPSSDPSLQTQRLPAQKSRSGRVPADEPQTEHRERKTKVHKMHIKTSTTLPSGEESDTEDFSENDEDADNKGTLPSHELSISDRRPAPHSCGKTAPEIMISDRQPAPYSRCKAAPEISPLPGHPLQHKHLLKLAATGNRKVETRADEPGKVEVGIQGPVTVNGLLARLIEILADYPILLCITAVLLCAISMPVITIFAQVVLEHKVLLFWLWLFGYKFW